MNDDDYRWIAAALIRTASGNWYYITPNSETAVLFKKVTSHPAYNLARSRIMALAKVRGAAMYNGKIKVQRNGNFDPSRRKTDPLSL